MKDQPLAVTLPIADWALIDGTLNGHGALASFADPALSKRVLPIRQAVWAQVPGWPDTGATPDTWPPEAVCTVRMDRTQWELVLDALSAAEPISQLISEDEWLPRDQRALHSVGATRSREIAADLRNALRHTEQER
ncbi:hypothetical protein [Arthrobacter sp. Marseille-P9274]|uniref:hypothetical protein n=1 Tax=Arthrobacter sp. Marseille-P9274 TaxID=2866572 RepID=UPI0021C8666A|nr:hypothetical protein [Arthrobacter sp. Marseille-P9274]